MVPLWTWDTDEPRVRPDRSYFARSHVNDTFPAHGAVERQWTLGEIVTALADAGLEPGVVDRAPRAVLAPRWSGRGGLGRPAAEHVHAAGPSELKHLGPVGAGH